MYPYNTSSKNNEPMVNMPNNAIKSEENSIKSDKRLEKIITMAQKDVIELQSKYKGLMEVGMLFEDRNLLQTMYLDEVKHEKQLEEVLYHLTKTEDGDESDNTLGDLDTDLGVKKALEELILLEMDNVNFYSNLAQSVPSREDTQVIASILSSIGTTKQTHGTGLSYLYAKYF